MTTLCGSVARAAVTLAGRPRKLLRKIEAVLIPIKVRVGGGLGGELCESVHLLIGNSFTAFDSYCIAPLTCIDGL